MAGMAASLWPTQLWPGHATAQSVELFTGIGDHGEPATHGRVLADCLVAGGLPAEALAILRTCIGSSKAAGPMGPADQ